MLEAGARIDAPRSGLRVRFDFQFSNRQPLNVQFFELTFYQAQPSYSKCPHSEGSNRDCADGNCAHCGGT